MVAVKTLADIVKPAARTTLRDACAVYRGQTHSCHWRRLLPLLYKGFRLRLNHLLDICVENMVEISKQTIVPLSQRTLPTLQYDVIENDAIVSLCQRTFSALERDLYEDHVPYSGDEPRTCIVCRTQWLRLERALTNFSYTATNLMRMDILNVMRKYFTVTAVLSPEACREVMDRKQTLSESFDVINDAVRNFGFDLNTQNSDGSTLLHLSVASGWTQPEVVEYLLQNGAKVDLRTNNGLTPLHTVMCVIDQGYFKEDVFAARQKNIVKILLKNGACINALDSTYRTPLNLVLNPVFVTTLHVELANILIQHGSIVNHGLVSYAVWYCLDEFACELFFETFLPLLRAGGLSLEFFNNDASACKYRKSPGECDCFRCLAIQAFVGCQERPESLAFICRMAIRNELIIATEGRSIYSAIDQLPVAELIKNYLKLEHI